jgi:hypothetical protein
VNLSEHFLKVVTVVAVTVGVAVPGATSAWAKAEKLTRTAAQAKAEASLLSASDFGPGWVAGGLPLPGETYSELGRQVGCSKADAAALPTGAKRGLGSAVGFTTKGVDSANFAVAVYPGVSGAKAYMKRARTRSFQECVNKADELFTEKVLLPLTVDATKTQEKLNGVDAGDDVVAYDCSYTLQGDVALTLDGFCYELRSGRAIASVNFPALPDAERQRLLDVLAARMKKA